MPASNVLQTLQHRHSRELNVGIAAFLVVIVSVFYYLLLDQLELCLNVFYFELRHHVHGILYLAPMTFASAAFGWRGYAITWLMCFAVHLPRGAYWSLSTDALLSNLGFWSVPLLAGAIVALERQWRSQQRQMFAERQREREGYVRRILETQEDERRRLAVELHDETLQDLIALAYAAEAAVAGVPASATESRAQIEWIKDQSVRISRELRRISSDLRPSVLDQLGLVPALRWLAERTTVEAGVSTDVRVQGDVERLNGRLESGIFRVVQEALANVRKHSGASRASVVLTFSPASLVVEVVDNGHGFRELKPMRELVLEGHIGVIGMRERAAGMGANLTIRSNPTAGTEVRMVIPGPATSVHADGSHTVSQ